MINDDAQQLRRRKLFVSCRRGMRELDLLLQGFLTKGFDLLNADEQNVFESLLEYPDPLLLKVLMGEQPADNKEVANIVEKIRACAHP